jgi:hypothetical protein
MMIVLVPHAQLGVETAKANRKKRIDSPGDRKPLHIHFEAMSRVFKDHFRRNKRRITDFLAGDKVKFAQLEGIGVFGIAGGIGIHNITEQREIYTVSIEGQNDETSGY